MSVRVEKSGPVTTVILTGRPVPAQEALAMGLVNRGFEEALRQEFERGVEILKSEALAGAARFTKGAGRHGKFE